MGWTLNELVGDSGFQNIELIDGVKEIQKDKKGWAFTKQIEQSMEELLKSIKKYKNSPTQNALEKAKQLLIRIEFWKANCMEEQTGHAAKNSDTAIWQAFYGVSKAKTDIEALLCIMDLKGFGSFADLYKSTSSRTVSIPSVMMITPPLSSSVLSVPVPSV